MSSPTIIDIARVAGVSFKTVSRVINNEGGFSEQTRERVEATIEKLGYRPNTWARSLRSTRTNTIALLSAHIKIPVPVQYYQQIETGILSACVKSGYQLMFHPVRREKDLVSQIEKIAAENRVDGIILSPPEADDTRIVDFLSTHQIPFVRISPYKRLDIGSYVQVNDKQAAYELTKYLLGLGHRDIALVQGPANHGSAKERYRGFMAAMEECGGHVNSAWIVAGDYTIKSGMDAGDELFSKPSKPTAILACNDNMAIGAMSAAYRHGLSLPEDVSIAGIDGNPMGEAFWPPLTTMYQPVKQIAQRAAEMLFGKINAPGSDKRKTFKLKLTVRESTAPHTGRRSR